MLELNEQEIEMVAGAGVLEWLGVADIVVDFCKGFVAGVKAGYNG